MIGTNTSALYGNKIYMLSDVGIRNKSMFIFSSLDLGKVLGCKSIFNHSKRIMSGRNYLWTLRNRGLALLQFKSIMEKSILHQLKGR